MRKREREKRARVRCTWVKKNTLRSEDVFVTLLSRCIIRSRFHLMWTRKASNVFCMIRRSFYDVKTKNDTIFATATTINNNKGSPLGVIRVSGSKTGFILKNITNFGEKKPLKPRHATLTKFFEPISREPIDLGLVIWFPGPDSYTGEDVCELHLHGSQAIVSKMLSTLGSIAGARPAEPGEFTRRAVMNGKMSLMQAESLPDLIKSSTDKQRRLALNGLDGSTRHKYEQWTDQLVSILAHLEASIDFGEDELLGELAVVSDCIEKLKSLASLIESYIEASVRCRDFINDGAKIAILGKPNAGKSTFMNLLCRRDLSIVSDLSGTTRDLVRHSLELGGHLVTLCDTAGLRNLGVKIVETTLDNNQSLMDKHESVEQEGIRRALDAAKEADILIYLVDGSSVSWCVDDSAEELEAIHNELSAALDVICDRNSTQDDALVGKPKFVHLVINKLDLTDDLNFGNSLTQLREIMNTKLLERQQHSIASLELSMISCKTQENFDEFVRSLTNRLDAMCSPPAEKLGINNDNRPVQYDYVNQRHLSLLRSMHRHLELAGRMDIQTIDKMAQHVRESVDYLSRVVGSISSEDVIDVIFRDFCIGK